MNNAGTYICLFEASYLGSLNVVTYCVPVTLDFIPTLDTIEIFMEKIQEINTSNLLLHDCFAIFNNKLELKYHDGMKLTDSDYKLAFSCLCETQREINE